MRLISQHYGWRRVGNRPFDIVAVSVRVRFWRAGDEGGLHCRGGGGGGVVARAAAATAMRAAAAMVEVAAVSISCGRRLEAAPRIGT